MIGALVDYARHEANLRQPTKDGADRRAYLEASAKRGNASAIAALNGPPFPEPVEYLWDWSQELFGRSGVTVDGIVPLTYATIESWSRLTHRTLSPREVDALIIVDAVLRHPDAGEAAP